MVTGACILVFAVHQLSGLTSQTGADDFFWPLIIRSFGTVLMFLPLNMATLGPIPKKDIAKASGFFNLTRQLGGSIGVALLDPAAHATPGVSSRGAGREDAARRPRRLQTACTL